MADLGYQLLNPAPYEVERPNEYASASVNDDVIVDIAKLPSGPVPAPMTDSRGVVHTAVPSPGGVHDVARNFYGRGFTTSDIYEFYNQHKNAQKTKLTIDADKLAQVAMTVLTVVMIAILIHVFSSKKISIPNKILTIAGVSAVMSVVAIQHHSQTN